jgi:hypothetical protein
VRPDSDRARRLCPSSTSRRCTLAAAAAVVCGLVVLFLIDPAGSSAFPLCPLHAMTGLHCPGCGTLRALHQLLHGNLRAALGLNPLMVCSLPFVAYWCLGELMRGVGGWRLPRLFLPAAWIWVLLGVIVLFGIVRNIPYYPWSLLAP